MYLCNVHRRLQVFQNIWQNSGAPTLIHGMASSQPHFIKSTIPWPIPTCRSGPALTTALWSHIACIDWDSVISFSGSVDKSTAPCLRSEPTCSGASESSDAEGK